MYCFSWKIHIMYTESCNLVMCYKIFLGSQGHCCYNLWSFTFGKSTNVAAISNSFNVFIDTLTCCGTDVPVNTLIDVLRGCGGDFRGRSISSCSVTELEVNFGGGISVAIRAAFVSGLSRDNWVTQSGSIFRLVCPTLAYKHSYQYHRQNKYHCCQYTNKPTQFLI